MSRAAAPDDQEALLAEVKRRVARMTGWHIHRTYEDQWGEYGFRASKNKQMYLVVAKRRAHEGLASFMLKVVDRAIGGNLLLVEFFGGDPTLSDAWVFRPDTVREAGRPSEGPSRKGVDTDWVELPRTEYGVMLGDYITGQAVPPAPPEARARQGRLGQFFKEEA